MEQNLVCETNGREAPHRRVTTSLCESKNRLQHEKEQKHFLYLSYVSSTCFHFRLEELNEKFDVVTPRRGWSWRKRKE